jgi:hypothetical protein
MKKPKQKTGEYQEIFLKSSIGYMRVLGAPEVFMDTADHRHGH